MTTPQWLVTDDGIEGAGRYDGYYIDKSRLGERRLGSGGALLDWPLHMAEKSGLDLRDFKRAFIEAVDRHRAHIEQPFAQDASPSRMPFGIGGMPMSTNDTATRSRGSRSQSAQGSCFSPPTSLAACAARPPGE